VIRTVYVGGHVYTPEDPFATALIVEAGNVAWTGQDGAAHSSMSAGDTVVDLRGALVTPGFVDAHVHHTAAGLALTGLDLSNVDGAAAFLQALGDHLQAHPTGVVLGHGWDESTWRDPTLPTREQIDGVCGNRPAYLSRADVHSALISSGLMGMATAATDPATEVMDMAGAPVHGGAQVTRDVHHLVRRIAQASISEDQRRQAIRGFRRHAASLGVVGMHECGGPDISGVADMEMLRSITSSESGPFAVLYWGQTMASGGSVMGAQCRGLAGDLFVDGSLGSRTALLIDDYADAPGHRGAAYLSSDEIRDHVIACTESGLQAGFHVIGDAAVEAALQGFDAAAQIVGREKIRAARHRLEHVELITAAHIARLADLGIAASVQPAFDERWGGDTGMYRERLGERARHLNPFAAMSAAGVILAFGSDAPVTPVAPWEGVRAAAFHRSDDQRISVRAAFAAHTRGGHRAAGDDHAGVLSAGAPAHLAIWEPSDLVVQAPDGRVAAWSTDPRSGTPGLPDVSPGQPVPVCVRTVCHGQVIHDSGWLG
jgi:predicted amidohydrolase YtcJ